MRRRLPSLKGRAVIAALERAGFYVHHIKGSHHVLRHPSKPRVRVVVAVHSKNLPTGTLRNIIKQADLTVPEFLDLL